MAETTARHRGKSVWVAVLLICAVLSVTVIRGVLTSADTYADTIASLDSKKETVSMLLASSTAAAVAISMIPDDTGTPIANELADLSSYFLLILSALYLEKYALTLLGAAASLFLLPAACGLGMWHVFCPAQGEKKRVAVKLAVTAMLICLIIPAGMWATRSIEATFQESIRQTMDTALQAEEGPPEVKEGGKSPWETIVDAANSVVNGVVGAAKWAKEVLNHFVEALAVMLTITCVIPIAILLGFVWGLKALWKADIGIPRVRRIVGKEQEDLLGSTDGQQPLMPPYRP